MYPVTHLVCRGTICAVAMAAAVDISSATFLCSLAFEFKIIVRLIALPRVKSSVFTAI